MANIEYTGDPARNNKGNARAFGGSHGSIKFYIPESDGNKPRIVLFAPKTGDEPLDPEQVEVVKAVLIGTELYREIADAPVQPVAPAKAPAKSVKDGE